MTELATGFFVLLGGVGGSNDCALGDMALFSVDNDRQLFCIAWTLS